MKKLLYLFLSATLLYSCGGAEQQTEENTNQDSTIMETDVQEPEIVGEEVSYSTEDGVQMNGYMAYDANNTDPKPGILVVHEWWGHNQHARDKAEALAEMGYVALAVDMYGEGKQADHPKKATEFMMQVINNIDLAKARFDKAYELLSSDSRVDSERMGAIGFCFGGSVVLTMANMGADLDAVAAFHSGIQIPVMPGENLSAKVLICNGEDDPMIKPEHVTAYKAALDSVGADYEYVSYPGVKHAYTNPNADSIGAQYDLPLAYDENAEQDSWGKMEDLFGSTFK